MSELVGLLVDGLRHPEVRRSCRSAGAAQLVVPGQLGVPAGAGAAAAGAASRARGGSGRARGARAGIRGTRAARARAAATARPSRSGRTRGGASPTGLRRGRSWLFEPALWRGAGSAFADVPNSQTAKAIVAIAVSVMSRGSEQDFMRSRRAVAANDVHHAEPRNQQDDEPRGPEPQREHTGASVTVRLGVEVIAAVHEADGRRGLGHAGLARSTRASSPGANSIP